MVPSSGVELGPKQREPFIGRDRWSGEEKAHTVIGLGGAAAPYLIAPRGVRAILDHLKLPSQPPKRALARGLPQ